MTSRINDETLDVCTKEALDDALKILLESDESVSVKEIAKSKGLPYAALASRYMSAREIIRREQQKSEQILKQLSSDQEKIITDELLKKNGLTETQFHQVVENVTKKIGVDYSKSFAIEFMRSFRKKNPGYRIEATVNLGKVVEEKLKEKKRKRNCERQRAYYQRQKDLKKNEETVPKSNAERQRKFRQRNAEKSYVEMRPANLFKEDNHEITEWSDKEKKLIDFVRQNKEIIIKGLIKHKTHIWSKISKIIQVPERVCAKRWRSIFVRHKYLFVRNPQCLLRPNSKYSDKRLSFLFKFYKDAGLKLCRPEPVYENTIDDDKGSNPENAVSYTTKLEVEDDSSSALKMMVTQRMVEDVLKHKATADDDEVFEDLAERYVKTLKFEQTEANVLKIVTESLPEPIIDVSIPHNITNSDVVVKNELNDETDTQEEEIKESDNIIHPDEMSTLQYFSDIAEYIVHQFPIEKHEQLRKNVLSIVVEAVQDDRR